MLTALAAMLAGVSRGESRKRRETGKACTMESHDEGVASHASSESLRQARGGPAEALGRRYGLEMRLMPEREGMKRKQETRREEQMCSVRGEPLTQKSKRRSLDRGEEGKRIY